MAEPFTLLEQIAEIVARVERSQPNKEYDSSLEFVNARDETLKLCAKLREVVEAANKLCAADDRRDTLGKYVIVLEDALTAIPEG